MKFSASILFVVVALVMSSHALPAKKRMIYVQQPAAQWYAAPQRMMYVQYVQPGLTHARSTQAASALVSGESVATGTYLKDCNHSESEITAAGPAVDADVEAGENILSVAEAVPAAESGEAAEAGTPVVAVSQEETAVVSDDASKVGREYTFEAEAAVPEVPEVPAVAVEAPVVPETVVPAVVEPAKRYLPSNKKVYVELDQSAETGDVEETQVAVADQVQDDDEEEEDEPVAVIPVVAKKPARRPLAKKPVKAGPATPAKPSKPALPAGTFFPIDFGGTSGGAIAIANSFSTGEGGSATSHAIAYGNANDAARARRPSTKRH